MSAKFNQWTSEATYQQMIKSKAFEKVLPTGLLWCPVFVKTKKNVKRYWIIKDHAYPTTFRQDVVRKNSCFLEEFLVLVSNLIHENFPLFSWDAGHTFKISSDNHLVIVPSSYLKVGGAEPNFLDYGKCFEAFIKAGLPADQLEIVISLKREFEAGDKMDMLRVKQLLPAFVPPAPVPVPPLDLSVVNTIPELFQALADHPDYCHLVKDIDLDTVGTVVQDFDLAVEADSPIGLAIKRILETPAWPELSDLLYDEEEEMPLVFDGPLQHYATMEIIHEPVVQRYRSITRTRTRTTMETFTAHVKRERWVIEEECFIDPFESETKKNKA